MSALLVLGSAAFLSWVPAPPAVAAEPQIELRLESAGEPTGEVPVRIPTGKDAGTVLFFATRAGTEELAGVSIKAPTAPNVVITSVSGENTFTLPAANAPLALSATVASITEPSDLRVPLLAIIPDGPPVSIGTLHVIRDDAPSLATLGGTNTANHTQETGRFSTTIDVVAGSTAVDATVQFGPFRDGQSRLTPLNVTIDGTPVSSGESVAFAPGALRSVTITGTLPRPVEYSGSVTFTYGPQRTSRLTLTLTVTRTAPDQSVVVDPTTPPTAAEIPFRLPGLTIPLTDVTTAVSFREDRSEEPTMAFEVIQVTRTEGTEERQVALDTALDPNSVSFPPLGSHTIKVTVLQLSQPGAYTLTLRGASPNNKPLDTTAKVLVRDSPWTAAVLILAGTLVSAGLRRWIGGARGQLEARVTVDDLGQRLRDLRPPNPDEPVRRLFALLDVKQRALVWRATDEGVSAAVTAATAAQRTRLNLAQAWLAVHARVLQVTDPQAKSDALMKLDAIIRLLDEPNEADAITKLAEVENVPGLPPQITAQTQDAEDEQQAQAEAEAEAEAKREKRRRFFRKVQLWVTDSVVYVVLASIATTLGVVALYLPESVWGSTKDWILAVLWGLGLHQVGTASAQGIQGLWRTYQTIPPSQ